MHTTTHNRIQTRHLILSIGFVVCVLLWLPHNVLASGSTLITDGSTQIGSLDVGTNLSYESLRIDTSVVGAATTTATTSDFEGEMDDTLSNTAGWTTVYDNNVDDDYVQISLGFNISFNGVTYSSLYVGSNAYITFGGGATDYSGFGGNVPAFPSVHIGAADRSYQKVFYKLDSVGTMRVRFEGAKGTSGTNGSPAVVYEAVFFEGQSYFDLHIGLYDTPTLTVNSVTAYHSLNPTTTLTATLYAPSGGYLSGESVGFLVNGVEAGTSTTNASGVATVTADISGLVIGSYSSSANPPGIKANFSASGEYSAVSGVGTLTVSSNTVLAVTDISIGYSGTTTLTAYLTDANTLPLSGKSIGLFLYGTFLGTSTTNSSGYATATVDVTGLTIGSYSSGGSPPGLKAQFAGDGFYDAVSDPGSLTITTRTITLEPATDSKVYDGTILGTVQPTIWSGSLLAGHTATFTQTFSSTSVGTYKVMTPAAGTIVDGSGTDVSSYYSVSRASKSLASTVTNPDSNPIIIGNYVYLFGGDGNEIQRAPVSDPTSWTQATGTLSYGVEDAPAIVVGDYVYIFGGSTGGSATSAIQRAPLSDPNTWEKTDATLPGAKFRYSFATTSDSVYIYAGSATSSIYMASTSDPLTWRRSANSMPYASLYGGRVITIASTSSMYIYDDGGEKIILRASTTNPGVWSSTGVSSGRRIGQVALIDNYIYIFGGVITNTDPSNTIYRAHVNSPTSLSLMGSTMPDTVMFGSIGKIGDHIYIFGGSTYCCTSQGLIYQAPLSDPLTWTAYPSINTGTITPKPITVGGITANDKFYDGTTAATLNATSASLLGVIGNDHVNVATSSAVGTFDTASSGADKTVTISNLSLIGNQSLNYSISNPTTLGNIGYELTVTGITASNKLYDGSTSTTLDLSGATLVGVQGADPVTLSTSSATGSFSTATPGKDKTVTISGLTISGASSTYYYLVQPTTTASIGYELTVTGITASNKAYDGTASATINANSASLVGVQGGDTVTLATSSAIGTFDSVAPGVAKVVTISGLTVSGSDSGEYYLVQPTTTADIIPPATSTLSGTVYYDEGVTALVGSQTIMVAVGTSTLSIHTTTTNPGDGSWSIALSEGNTIVPGTPIVVWIDGDTTFRAAHFTKASSTNASIPNLDLYKDRIIISHEGTTGTSTTIADLSFYDTDNDMDIPFSATTSPSALLSIKTGNELYIKGGKHFNSGGMVVVNGNASASSTDGSLRLSSNATYTAGGNTTLGGSFRASSTATFTHNNYLLSLVATTTGKVIDAPLSSLGPVSFNGASGAWSFARNATTTSLAISKGALTAPSDSLAVESYFNGGSFNSNGGLLSVSGPTDSITADVMRYVFGRDSSGNATGTASTTVYSTLIAGNYLFVGKDGNSTSCSQVASAAIGCELMVFDISSSTNPVYVAGRDSSGSSDGLGGGQINTLSISGDYLFVGKSNNANACSQVAGAAYGCELMVFDISSSTNPVFVAGRDASGNAVGIGNISIQEFIVSGRSLYVGKATQSTACSQTAGSAIGCELMVFDISSSTNPVYAAGRDSDGSATSTLGPGINAFAISGNHVYVGKDTDTTACTQRVGSADGCELMVFDISSSTNPVYVAGRDSDGSATSTLGPSVNALSVSSDILYVGKSTDSSTCVQSAGSADGCEIMLFSVASATNPVYLSGADASGSLSGTSGSSIYTLGFSDIHLYAGTAGNSTACSQTIGSAYGCELVVFSVASSTNPVFVAGRDGSGSNAGTTSPSIYSLSISGDQLYVGKTGTTSACSTVAGNANGCEIAVYDIASRDSTGLLSGRFIDSDALADVTTEGTVRFYNSIASTTDFIVLSGTTTISGSLSVSGDYTNNGILSTQVTDRIYVEGNGSQSLSGTLTGSSTLPMVVVQGSGTKTFQNNASTSDMTIRSGVSVVAPSKLSILGNYSNEGTFIAPSGQLTLTGSYNNSGTFNHNNGMVEIRSSVIEYLAGRDASGNATGTDGVYINAFARSGNYLYVGKAYNGTTCSQSSGSAIGCELMVFDISSSTNPVYVAGRDSSGSASGNGTDYIFALAIYGNYLYVGKDDYSLACSQVAGSASGCELMVFDISSSTNPIYIAGRDASGSAGGTGSVSINSFAITGNYLYVGKSYSSTACSQSSGSAIGCELMAFDISSSTNPTYVAGRDVYGSATETGNKEIYQITISGNTLYAVTEGSRSSCSQIAGSAYGCELLVFDISSSTNPVFVAGRDESGGADGPGYQDVYSAVTSDDFLYLGKSGSSTACAQVVGLAEGCELVVFDISSSTNPLFVAGQDAGGKKSGSDQSYFWSMDHIGDLLIAGKWGPDSTACSQVAGSAIGCELMVFDISSSTNPAYVAGIDSDGSATSTLGPYVSKVFVTNGLIYVGKGADGTACAQVTGAADGCEFMILKPSASISGSLTDTNSFNNLTVSGTGGNFKSNASTTNLTLSGIVTVPAQLTVSGNFANNSFFNHNGGNIYFSSTSPQSLSGTMTGNGSFASTTFLGSGTKTFSANASTTNFIVTAGAVVASTSLTVAGNFANSGTYTAGRNLYFSSTTNQTISGTLVDTSSLGTTTFLGQGTKTFASNASTSGFIIGTTTTVVFPAQLSIAGNYQNSGTTTAGSGTTTFSGTSIQTATGTMTGVSQFYNLAIRNRTGSGSSTQSVIFNAPVSATGTFSMTGSTSVQLLSNATSTFKDVHLSGSAGEYVWLRATSPNQQAGLSVVGTQQEVMYVDVKDSHACSGNPNISAVDGTSVDAGGNSCWDFPSEAQISSGANQVFMGGQGSTSISTITITESITTPHITAANDIRIAIGTSTTQMKWDAQDVTATFGGTASAKVSNPVSYERDNTVLVIPVNSDFALGETITVSDLSFGNFTAVAPAANALTLLTDGPADYATNDSDDKTITVTGALTLANHSGGQTSDNLTFSSDTNVPLFAFNLTPTYESVSVSGLSFSLLGVNGVTTTKLSNLTIYKDSDSDKIVDGGELSVAAGTLLLGVQTGSITFASPISATTSTDFIFVADTSSIRPGDMLTVSLSSSDIIASGAVSLATITPSGSASRIQHVRGGLGTAGTPIGGDFPAAVTTTGGESSGGDSINPDEGDSLSDGPGYRTPASHGTPQSQWNGGGNAYTSDGTYATTSTNGHRHSYGSFTVNVPGNQQIIGIEVKLEASASTNAGTIDVALSYDGGGSLTTPKTTTTLTTSDAVYTLGAPTDTWGRSWTTTETNNTNLQVEVIANTAGNTINLDTLRVIVHTQATGGGGGGGGMVLVPGGQYFASAQLSISPILAEIERILISLRALLMGYVAVDSARETEEAKGILNQ